MGGSEGRGLEDSGRLEDAMLLTLKTDNKLELKEEGRSWEMKKARKLF